MSDRIDKAIQVFRYKRMNIKAISWAIAIIIFLGMLWGINALSTIQPWVSFVLLICALALAIFAYTYYNDFRLRRALSELDFILDEFKDPKQYLELLDSLMGYPKKKITPAYLHARLRGMMYISTAREIQEFMNQYQDVLGTNPSTLTAIFRIKDHGEQLQSLETYEKQIESALNKAHSRARSMRGKEEIEHQRNWFFIQTLTLKRQYQAVLDKISDFDFDSLTPLEQVRALYFSGIAYMWLGDTQQAKQCFNQVIAEGNTTRFVVDAKQELMKVGK